MAFTASDHRYMARALQLAEQGMYSTMPNPRVGCVIVKDDVIVGEGAHLKAGEPHAEIFALQQAGDKTKGATLYVTLEPCSHTGRTPPCSQAIIESGISKVIAAMQDPNPQVAGRGLALCQSQKIEVATGLMESQARALNPGFIARMTRQSPFVRSKIAASLDGITALNNGQSKWITQSAARQDVQNWRARSCAILTGIGSVLADNPSMSVRDIATPRQPLKVVVDSQLRISPQAKILQNGPVLIAFAADNHNHADGLLTAGAELLCIPQESQPADEAKVCLKTLLSHLASIEVNEVLCEAGENLNGALMQRGLIDELLIYYAPKLMGASGKSMFALPAFKQMDQAIDLDIIDIRQIGADIRLRAKPIISAPDAD